MLSPAPARSQNYSVETYKLFELFGNVKAFSCGGGCCEGHDSTACVGIQVLHENESHQYVLNRTAIFDNVSCCDAQCAERQGCGIYSKDGPANSCPNNTTHFSVAIGSGTSLAGNLGLCVAPGQVFTVPWRIALLGNVVNNSPASGSKCNASNTFEAYNNDPFGTDTWGANAVRWGGFSDSCPNPANPDIVCVPSDCDPGPSGAVPRHHYGVEVISPYGNEYLSRWDVPLVTLRWRATTPDRLDSYRLVVYGPSGVFLDKRIACTTVECYHAAEFPLEAESYYWWVQPVSDTETGEQSRAGVFNLWPPLPSCAGIGGACAYPTQPNAPVVCAEGSTFIYGALDCPDTCCAVDCASEQSHSHTGSCGSSDVCGHVFGTPTDAGCGGGTPPDTLSCGQLGGEHCSTSFSCPSGYVSLGTTRQGGALECQTCCNQTIGDGYCEPGVEDCGTSPADCPCWVPGATCNASGSPGQCVDRCSSPAYHDHSGSCGQADVCGHVFGDPRDCAPTCGAMGGDYCSQSPGWCPSGANLGQSSDCRACCRLDPCADPGSHDHYGSCGSTDSCGHVFGDPRDCTPTCGAMGGDYCSQSPGWCPGGANLGQSSDCRACCRLDPCADPGGHDHQGSCGSTDSCGHSFGSAEDCGCPGTPCGEEPPDMPVPEVPQ